MASSKTRLYRLDGDTVEVSFNYDENQNRFFGNYPDFSENPRRTPSGKSWVNVTLDGCKFADSEFGDCGSCPYFRCEKDGDLIGICENENLLYERKEA